MGGESGMPHAPCPVPHARIEWRKVEKRKGGKTTDWQAAAAAAAGHVMALQ